jgi:hypothetical protein
LPSIWNETTLPAGTSSILPTVAAITTSVFLYLDLDRGAM